MSEKLLGGSSLQQPSRFASSTQAVSQKEQQEGGATMGDKGRDVQASLLMYAVLSSLMLVVNKGAVMMIPEPIKLLLLQVSSASKHKTMNPCVSISCCLCYSNVVTSPSST